MKRIPSSDSLGALHSMCPTDEHNPRNRDLYSREFQSMLDGFDDEGCVDESGHGSSKKRRLSIDQVKALEKNFEVENKLEPERKVKLAQELGLQPRQVAVWFQNRRARWKTKQLERDFGVLKANLDALKVNYDALKHDNDALLKEIEELKSKLNKENSTESDLSVKEEVFMPDSGNNHVEELGLRPTQLISRTSAETKDGSFDGDSSAILNEENSNSSPNPAISSSKAVQSSEPEKTLTSTPGASASPKFGGFQPPASQNQHVKAEERDFFGVDEACNFFSVEQAPSLHWQDRKRLRKRVIRHHGCQQAKGSDYLSTRVDCFFTPDPPEKAKVKPCPKAGVSARIREDLKRMQRSAAHLEADLWKLKERLIETERGWDQALEDLEESRREVDEANAKLREAFTPMKVPEIYTELNSLKKLLANASRELKVKEKENGELRVEIERRKDVEARLAEQDAAVEKLGKELENVRIAEERIKSDHGMRIRELECELEKRKESEARMADSLAAVTKQLEQTNIVLEESNLEMMAQRTKNNKDANATNNRSEENGPSRQITGNPGAESAEKKLARVNDETRKLKVELRMSVIAEENSKKAMDDLAIALKEVVNESNQGKLKLDVTLAELEHSQQEEANLRTRLKATEEMYKKLHDELRGENEQLKSTMERLRSEAEESLAAWTTKEASFIECIRAAEDEKTNAQQESIRMGETLKAADRMVKSSREENNKLRDILKQALNEASVAKEAASIARAENSQLKDDLAEKDDALNFLTQENESLRTNEAVLMETIRELKKLVNGSSMTIMGEEQRKSKPHAQPTNGKRLGKAFSFNLKEIRVHHHHHHHLDHPKHNKESRSDFVDLRKSREDSDDGGDPLRGSIFDIGCSPDSLHKHRRKNSWSAFASDREMAMLEDREHNVVDRCRLDGPEVERMSRKKVALLRRFGDLMRRRSYSDKTPAF